MADLNIEAHAWAKRALDRKPQRLDFAGISREAASRRAVAVCSLAAITGQTIKAHAILTHLVPILERPV